MRNELFVFLQDCYPAPNVVAMSSGVVVYQVKDNPLTHKVRTCSFRYQEIVASVGEVKVVLYAIKADCEGIAGSLVSVQVLLFSNSGTGSYKHRKVLQVQVVRIVI